MPTAGAARCRRQCHGRQPDPAAHVRSMCAIVRVAPVFTRSVPRVAAGTYSIAPYRRQRRTDAPGRPSFGGPVSPSRATSTPTARRRSAARRTYVLDTSVLLADPGAIARFDEHEVVLPIVVITELEAKRDHPELGWFARQSLRLLDELRVAHGRLDVPLQVNDAGGTVRVELNHTDPTVLPPGHRRGGTDSRLLAAARTLRARRERWVGVVERRPDALVGAAA